MDTKAMIRELNAVAEKHKNDFVPTCQTNITAMCKDIIPKLEHLQAYEEIGTVEECREAVEKQKVSKPRQVLLHTGRNGFECMNCGNELSTDTFESVYCHWCGQRLEDGGLIK